MATATWSVFPTENNIHHTVEETDATAYVEARHRELYDPDSDGADAIRIGGNGARVIAKPTTAFTGSINGLDLDITGGVLIAAGYVIKQVGTQSVTFPASSDKTLYLNLAMSAGLVSVNPAYLIDVYPPTATPPLRGIAMFRVITNGSVITSFTSYVPTEHPDYLSGTYVGVASATEMNRVVGFHPSRVEVSEDVLNGAWGSVNRGDAFTNNKIAGLTNVVDRRILLTAFGFQIRGITTGTNNNLAENGVTYRFKAWR